MTSPDFLSSFGIIFYPLCPAPSPPPLNLQDPAGLQVLQETSSEPLCRETCPALCFHVTPGTLDRGIHHVLSKPLVWLSLPSDYKLLDGQALSFTFGFLVNNNCRDWGQESASQFPGVSPTVTSAGVAGAGGQQTWLERQRARAKERSLYSDDY